MMGCDHPSFIQICLLVGELWHFQYVPTWRPSAFWILKILIFDHVTVIKVLICCFVPNFIIIGSRVRTAYAHNFWMFNAPLLGNDRCHGKCFMADRSGTMSWWDATVAWVLHGEFFGQGLYPPARELSLRSCLFSGGRGRRPQLASGTSSSEEIWLVARTDCCQEYYFIEFILISYIFNDP